MWIVKVALNRPYTFIVLALLIVLLSPVVTLRTPSDIFPDIDIPLVSVGWTYTGLNTEELEGRLTSPYVETIRGSGGQYLLILHKIHLAARDEVFIHKSVFWTGNRDPSRCCF